MYNSERPVSPSPGPVKMKEILKDTLSWFVRELKETGINEEFEKEIIDPILRSIFQRLLPYILTSSIIFLLVIITLILGIAWFLPSRVIHNNI